MDGDILQVWAYLLLTILRSDKAPSSVFQLFFVMIKVFVVHPERYDSCGLYEGVYYEAMPL